jgi:hypothetical protein
MSLSTSLRLTDEERGERDPFLQPNGPRPSPTLLALLNYGLS